MILHERGPFADTLQRLIRALRAGDFSHIFIGAVAVQAHGVPAGADEIEVCLAPRQVAAFRQEYLDRDYGAVPGRYQTFFDLKTQVLIHVYEAGEPASEDVGGRGVLLPTGDEAVEQEGIPVPTLARLIELKLAGSADEDLGTVAALIRAHGLTRDFAQSLSPVVRARYHACCQQLDPYRPERD